MSCDPFAPGRGDKLAVIYDSPLTNTLQKITYKQLLEQVLCSFSTLPVGTTLPGLSPLFCEDGSQGRTTFEDGFESYLIEWSSIKGE